MDDYQCRDVDREVAPRSQLPHGLKGIKGVRFERRIFRPYIDDSVRSLQHISHDEYIMVVPSMTIDWPT